MGNGTLNNAVHGGRLANRKAQEPHKRGKMPVAIDHSNGDERGRVKGPLFFSGGPD